MMRIFILFLIFISGCSVPKKGYYANYKDGYIVKIIDNKTFEAFVNFRSEAYAVYGTYYSRGAKIFLLNNDCQLSIDDVKLSQNRKLETTYVKINTAPPLPTYFGASVHRDTSLFYRSDENFIIVPKVIVSDSLQVSVVFYFETPTKENMNAFEVLTKQIYFGKSDTVFISISNYKNTLACTRLPKTINKRKFRRFREPRSH